MGRFHTGHHPSPSAVHDSFPGGFKSFGTGGGGVDEGGGVGVVEGDGAVEGGVAEGGNPDGDENGAAVGEAGESGGRMGGRGFTGGSTTFIFIMLGDGPASRRLLTTSSRWRICDLLTQ
jgi:hypothetical protein